MGARLIAIGYVTGDVLPELEAHLLAGHPRDARTYIEQRHVRVTPVEVLHGQQAAPLVVPVDCGDPSPGLEERVVFGITREGRHWVYSANFFEDRVRQAAGDGL